MFDLHADFFIQASQFPDLEPATQVMRKIICSFGLCEKLFIGFRHVQFFEGIRRNGKCMLSFQCLPRSIFLGISPLGKGFGMRCPQNRILRKVYFLRVVYEYLKLKIGLEH